ncbi:DMT family transporter [Ochrobactrum teleogrylli]|uniref:DMT family transporter n=1 Tax=Ochrobactrum teleogrylli TaxID=2479765 RepID=A0ABY2XY89_9HYPH|nr:DMT family transporter [[Ochrobactrum] teleogrylli]TNV09342.1 DMT family transporter [[Ochrobactrum] teleogrylli]
MIPHYVATLGKGINRRSIWRGRESVFLCLLAMALFAASDAIAKKLSVSFHPIQIAWFRYLAAAALLIVICLRTGLPRPSARPGEQITRGFGMAGATILLVMALRLQPMAEATALVFLSPSFVTLLSVLLLKERVNSSRWLGVAGGLIGVMVILRPGLSAYNPAALFSIASAACWATAMVMTRKAVLVDTLETTLAYSAISGLVVLTLGQPFVFVVPNLLEGTMAVLMGLLWLAAHVAIAVAYRRPEAQLSRLAPVSYTHLLWAVGLGYLVFGSIPDALTLLGAAVIVLSGLATFRMPLR